MNKLKCTYNLIFVNHRVGIIKEGCKAIIQIRAANDNVPVANAGFRVVLSFVGIQNNVLQLNIMVNF